MASLNTLYNNNKCSNASESLRFNRFMLEVVSSCPKQIADILSKEISLHPSWFSFFVLFAIAEEQHSSSTKNIHVDTKPTKPTQRNIFTEERTTKKQQKNKYQDDLRQLLKQRVVSSIKETSFRNLSFQGHKNDETRSIRSNSKSISETQIINRQRRTTRRGSMSSTSMCSGKPRTSNNEDKEKTASHPQRFMRMGRRNSMSRRGSMNSCAKPLTQNYDIRHDNNSISSKSKEKSVRNTANHSQTFMRMGRRNSMSRRGSMNSNSVPATVCHPMPETQFDNKVHEEGTRNVTSNHQPQPTFVRMGRRNSMSRRGSMNSCSVSYPVCHPMPETQFDSKVHEEGTGNDTRNHQPTFIRMGRRNSMSHRGSMTSCLTPVTYNGAKNHAEVPCSISYETILKENKGEQKTDIDDSHQQQKATRTSRRNSMSSKRRGSLNSLNSTHSINLVITAANVDENTTSSKRFGKAKLTTLKSSTVDDNASAYSTSSSHKVPVRIHSSSSISATSFTSSVNTKRMKRKLTMMKKALSQSIESQKDVWQQNRAFENKLTQLKVEMATMKEAEDDRVYRIELQNYDLLQQLIGLKSEIAHLKEVNEDQMYKMELHKQSLVQITDQPEDLVKEKSARGFIFKQFRKK